MPILLNYQSPPESSDWAKNAPFFSDFPKSASRLSRPSTRLSGKPTKSYWSHGPVEIVDLPNKNGDNGGSFHTPRIQSMDYLHAFGYARSQSVRPCYLRSDHDFCMHFRQFIFRLISDKFRQSMGNSRWPCHGLSRSVTAFSDNAQDLSIVFCLLSRFVTVCHATC